uniref:Cholesterol side-chain cleavage enzyme, mitochondrial n=1 Tax=Timema genevievae TaxID=629358 RepID=A0A7R9K7E9_TIMGE|nr:unnamed protein product [Timema genevievae]
MLPLMAKSDFWTLRLPASNEERMTAYTMQWVFYLLAQHPEVQDRLYEELKGIEGAENVIQLPLLKGQLIVMSLYTSGRDGKHFPEPDVFKPERWCRNQAGTYRGVENPYASLPFAMGARSCVGRKIAESQILLTLAEPCENNSHTGISTDTEEQNTAVDNFPKPKPKSPPLKPPPTKEKKLSQLSSMVVKRFKLSLVDTQPVEMVLELVAVPSKPIRLHLAKRWQLCNERTAGVEDANSSHCAAPVTSHKQCTYHRGQFCRCCMMMLTTHTTQSNSTSDSPGTVLPVATAAAFYGFELHWAHSVD